MVDNSSGNGRENVPGAATEKKEVYKSHEIIIRTEENRPELYIDGKHIATVRDRSGVYIAAGFAFSPQRSMLSLAKRIIDYQISTKGR